MSDVYAIPSAAPDGSPPAPRPPLTRRQLRGAIIAGAVGFSAVGLGFLLFVVPIVIGIVLLVLRGVAGLAGRIGGDDPGIRPFVDFVESVDPGPWVALLVVVSLVGVALMVGGILASRAILRAHGVHRPAAVSWAGLGIAVATSTVVGGGFSSVSSGVVPGSDPNADTIGAIVTVLAVVSTVVSVVVNAAVGGLAWWWMAIALRGPAVGVPATDATFS